MQCLKIGWLSRSVYEINNVTKSAVRNVSRRVSHKSLTHFKALFQIFRVACTEMCGETLMNVYCEFNMQHVNLYWKPRILFEKLPILTCTLLALNILYVTFAANRKKLPNYLKHWIFSAQQYKIIWNNDCEFAAHFFAWIYRKD